MRKFTFALSLLAVAFTAGVAWSQQAPAARPRAAARAAPAASVKGVATPMQIMKTMTIPFSDVVFMAGSEPPKDQKGWTNVQEQAIALAEAGNLLMVGGRSKGPEWMRMARAQVDAAEAAAKAAAAKNGDRLSTAADTLYETCANCHKKYMPNK
jgi:cytochrome c556